VNLIPDTNVLLRAIVRDDERQARVALKLLKGADIIAISLLCLCEVVWVLRNRYRFTAAQTFAALDTLLNSETVRVNRPAVEAGLALLREGGDFADAIIAHEGSWLGGDTFASFDQQAVTLLAQRGLATKLLD
jgi:predicted nucleic-acid-binding protein